MEAAITARPRERKGHGATVAGGGTLGVASLLVLSVIGFEQFLHTSPAAQSGSLGYEALYWLSDALFALPFAAFAVWAGSRIADRWGLGSDGVWSVFGRAGLIALAFGVLLIPGWFLHDDLDSLAHTAAVASGHAGHSHGGSDEVHWAGDTVFRILIVVPLAAAALWGGVRIGWWLSRGRGRATRLIAPVGVVGVLLAAALSSAWFLELGADAADSGQVTYSHALSSGPVRPSAAYPHSASAMPYMGPISATASNTEGSPAAEVAHALRDGLAGQAVGLPVMFFVLLWRTGRRPAARRRFGLTAKEDTR
jgi:hypothetical protein